MIYIVCILVLFGIPFALGSLRSAQKKPQEEQREKALSELDQLALLRRQGRVTDEDYEEIKDMILEEGGDEEALPWEEMDLELSDDLPPDEPETHDHIPSMALSREKRLEQLKALREAGLVDDREYRQRRREILEE